jgi:quercetin dioxygenase-like cupin family protein
MSSLFQLSKDIHCNAVVFKPNAGEIVNFLGNTITFKSTPNQDWRFFEIIGAAGGSTPLHTHPWSEGFYVLEGEIDIQIEDQVISASPGYCFQIPAGTVHGSQIRSPQVKLFNWVSDISAEQFVKAMAQQTALEAMLTIQQKYQVLTVENVTENVKASAAQSASVFRPGEGRIISVLGDTLACKSSDAESWHFFELVGSRDVGPLGSNVPPHTHPWDTGLYVLAGEVEVLLDQQTVQATPGYCIQMPAGTLHTYRILSPQARFLCWAADDRAEAGFQKLAQTKSSL